MVAKTNIYKKPENASRFLNKEEKIVSYQAPSRSYVSNTPWSQHMATFIWRVYCPRRGTNQLSIRPPTHSFSWPLETVAFILTKEKKCPSLYSIGKNWRFRISNTLFYDEDKNLSKNNIWWHLILLSYSFNISIRLMDSLDFFSTRIRHFNHTAARIHVPHIWTI